MKAQQAEDRKRKEKEYKERKEEERGGKEAKGKGRTAETTDDRCRRDSCGTCKQCQGAGR